MDENTKRLALEKLQYMDVHVAYPTEFYDDKELDKLYDPLVINPDSYLKGHLSIDKFINDRAVRNLLYPVKRDDWITNYVYSVLVNAFYAPNRNSMSKLINLILLIVSSK